MQRLVYENQELRIVNYQLSIKKGDNVADFFQVR